MKEVLFGAHEDAKAVKGVGPTWKVNCLCSLYHLKFPLQVRRTPDTQGTETLVIDTNLASLKKQRLICIFHFPCKRSWVDITSTYIKNPTCKIIFSENNVDNKRVQAQIEYVINKNNKRLCKMCSYCLIFYTQYSHILRYMPMYFQVLTGLNWTELNWTEHLYLIRVALSVTKYVTVINRSPEPKTNRY